MSLQKDDRISAERILQFLSTKVLDAADDLDKWYHIVRCPNCTKNDSEKFKDKMSRYNALHRLQREFIEFCEMEVYWEGVRKRNEDSKL